MRTLIQTQEQFNYAVKAISEAEYLAVDTETNGLSPHGENVLIGISVYIPATGDGFYFPFRHGYGRVEVNYTGSNSKDMDYHDMNWSGRTKKQLFIDYWYTHYVRGNFGLGQSEWKNNLPIHWLDALKEAFGHQTLLFHNASFDLDFLIKEGFPRPPKALDSMVSLHLVHEDWKGIKVKDAPYTYTGTDVRKNLAKKDQIGQWATYPDGSLKRKEQHGNRRLKWQSAMWGFDRATEGEQQLEEARKQLEEDITTHIVANLHNPMAQELNLKNPLPVRLGKSDKPKMKKVSEGYYIGLSRAYYVFNTPDPRMIFVDKDYKNWQSGFWRMTGDLEWEKVDPEPDHIFHADDYLQVFKIMVAYGRQWDKVRAKVYIDPKANMWMLPASKVWDYAVLDVELTHQLQEKCLTIIDGWDNRELHDIQQAVMYEVAWEMGQTGFKIDPELIRERIAEYDARKEELYLSLSPINPGSPKQVLEHLQYLGLEVEGTSKEHLEKYEDHPFVKSILEYRKLQKSSDVYLKSWLEGADPDGFVHFNMDSIGTVSGRFSSWGKPAGNAQNIPDRGGYRVKEVVVVPDDEWIFLAIDYGQLEARLAAWIAEGLLGYGNKQMTNLFLDGADMHSYVADTLGVRDVLFPGMSYKDIGIYMGEDWDKLVEVEGEEDAEHIIYRSYVRQVGKTMNFGLLYSGTEYMLSKLLKIELEPAKVLVDRWRDMFPAFGRAQKHYFEESLTERLKPDGKGYQMYSTQPISNRHRKLSKYSTVGYYTDEDGLTKRFNPRESSAKKVWNNIVQGLGGYIATVSGLHINRSFGDRVRWFANIHDALDGYIRKDSLDVVPEICNIMTDWEIVPGLTVDVESSTTNWQDMREVKDMQAWIASEGKSGYKS